jgi:hypothetical protein
LLTVAGALAVDATLTNSRWIRARATPHEWDAKRLRAPTALHGERRPRRSA